MVISFIFFNKIYANIWFDAVFLEALIYDVIVWAVLL